MKKWRNPIEPIIYTPDAIDRDLKRVVGASFFRFPYFHAFFETMYLLGCRAREVTDISLWEIADGGSIVLSPLKNNDKRVFSKEYVSEVFYDYIVAGAFPLQGVNYSRLQQEFKRLSLYNHIYIGNKKASLHLFRHNFVKKLVSQGHTEEEIKNILGEKNIKSVKSYTESVYTNRPISEY